MMLLAVTSKAPVHLPFRQLPKAEREPALTVWALNALSMNLVGSLVHAQYGAHTMELILLEQLQWSSYYDAPTTKLRCPYYALVLTGTHS